jgi:hypothetical protein
VQVRGMGGMSGGESEGESESEVEIGLHLGCVSCVVGTALPLPP